MRLPNYLSSRTKNWLKELAEEYQFESHHWKILILAGEALDRYEEARKAVERDGAYFKDRWGCPKPHPGLAVMRDCKTIFARLLRELGLDLKETPDMSRPPSRY